MAEAPRDQNFIPTVLLESSTNPGTVLSAKGDQITGRLLVDSASGSGDVVGPASATDSAIVLFDGTTGKLIKDSTQLLSGLVPYTAATGNVNLGTHSLLASNVTVDSNGGFDFVDAVTSNPFVSLYSEAEDILSVFSQGGGNVATLDFSGITGTDKAFVFPNASGTFVLDSDLSGYALLAGRAGGQTLIGGTASGENLTLQSTAHATRGSILFGSDSAYDEVNVRLGIGITSPTASLHIQRASASVLLETTGSNPISFIMRTANAAGDALQTFENSGDANNSWRLGRVADGTFRLQYDAAQPFASATNMVTVLTSGNVGLGTTGPTSKLHVLSSGTAITASASAVAVFQRNTGTGTDATISIIGGNAATSQLWFGDAESENVGRLNYSHSLNAMRFYTAGTDRLTLDSGNLSPSTTDTLALGTTALMWSDLFLAEGGTLNWNNGDVLITQSTNTLTFSGASSGYSFDGPMILGQGATAAGELRLLEDSDDGSNYSAFRGSARAGNIIYTMPTADPTAGQVLSAGAPSGGISALSWETASAGSSTPKMHISDIFVNTNRYDITNGGGATTAISAGNGLRVTCSTANDNSRIELKLQSGTNNPKVFAQSPTFSTVFSAVNFAAAGTAQLFFGIGALSWGGVNLDFTNSHIGFKILRVAGVYSLYATQADGSTENVSSALTTLATDDEVELVCVVNSTASVDYYWRKNGGALSSATNLTSNLPTADNRTLSWANTVQTSNACVIDLIGWSYER